MSIRKILILIIMLSCISLIVPDQVFAGAWTAKEKAMYNKLQLNYYRAKKRFEKNGDEVATGSKFEDYNVTYYAEYGIKDNFTVMFSIPFKTIKNSNGENVSSTGVGDIDFAMKYRLFSGNSTVVSIQGLFKLPKAYNEDRALPLGNGQVDFEGRLLFGKSFYPLPFYFGAEAGYRIRFEEPSDEFKYLIELGFSVTDNFYLRTKLDGSISMQNADDTTTAEGTPTLSSEFDLGKLELSAGYSLNKKLGVEFTYTPDLYGENISSGRNLQLAMIYMF